MGLLALISEFVSGKPVGGLVSRVTSRDGVFTEAVKGLIPLQPKVKKARTRTRTT
jgi:hypothetical protein